MQCNMVPSKCSYAVWLGRQPWVWHRLIAAYWYLSSSSTVQQKTINTDWYNRYIITANQSVSCQIWLCLFGHMARMGDSRDVNSRATQGLEAPPRTSTSHLASDPGSRPSATQSWPELSMATSPGQRMLKAARGNSYTPVRGSPVMMMTYELTRISCCNVDLDELKCHRW